MFSSIEEEQYLEVISKCYWPLFKLAENGYKIGIELSGLTLDLICSLDPSWVNRFKALLEQNKVELIGSGYSQIIGPLVPAKLNEWNQLLGMSTYRKLLGVVPEVALVNEMAYSEGLVEIYVAAGYKAIIMEWNNAKKYNKSWEELWHWLPQIAKGGNNYSIPVIWADSIIFQKFQRYVHGEINQEDYFQFQESKPQNNYYPLYCNDVEIFDFRPGRYKTEKTIISAQSEWDKIISLFEALIDNGNSTVFPSEVILGITTEGAGNLVNLSNSVQPIPVKKQDKYNINRWALSGRSDFEINTKCYQLYDIIHSKQDKFKLSDWKELCFLWSSDFRTHITKTRWKSYSKRLALAENNWKLNGGKIDNKHLNNQYHSFESDETGQNPIGLAAMETPGVKIILNRKRGGTIEKCIFNKLSDLPLFGRVEHGFYEDISLGADFYSGHTVIFPAAKHKFTDILATTSTIEKEYSNIISHSEAKDGGTVVHTKLSLNSESLTIKKTISLSTRFPGIIHPINFTLIPKSWDRKSLYFATKNGGNSYEYFNFGEIEIDHGSYYSPLISSLQSLGATNGELIIGDSEKKIKFTHNPAIGAMLPSIKYLPIDKEIFFCRVTYSALEMDETFRSNNFEHIIASSVTITPITDE